MGIALAGPLRPVLQVPPLYVGTFTNIDAHHSGAQNPHIWESADGLAWTQREVGFFDPTNGVSDCSFTWWNGTWWMAYTGGGTGAGVTAFGLASSPDLDYWTVVASVSTASISGAVNTWAPEWFLDPNDPTGRPHVYVTVSTSGFTAFKIYELHPTNDAMTAWSSPVAITLAGGSPSWTSSMIDAFPVYHGGNYALWAKAEAATFGDTTTYLGYLTASSLTGTWTAQHGGTNWMGIGSGFEGVSLVQVAGAHWRMYCNAVNTPQIYYSDSADDWATWSALTAITALASEGHGTIYKRPAGQMV